MLISITDIITESFKLYKNNFKRLFVYMALTFAPGALIIISKFLLTYFFPGTTIGALGISFLIFVMVSILLTAMSFWFNLAFIRVLVQIYTGQTTDTAGAEIMHAKKVFWAAIGVTILTTLATLGGFLLLFIPGIIFMLWFAFSYIFVAVDETSVMDSMHKSKALVDGRWWQVLYRVIVPSLIFGILISIVIGIVGSPLTYILNQTSKTSDLYQIWRIMTDLISSFASAIVSPLITIGLVVLFVELKKTPVSTPETTVNTSEVSPTPPTEQV